MTDYEKGYVQGVADLKERLVNYYNTLGGKTVGSLVAYTVVGVADSLSERILGGEGYVLPSKEDK